jgi:hypothetical protein
MVAQGGGLFDITATGASSSASASGSNVVNLVTDLTNNNQQFATLSGQNYNASLNYAGIPNAVHVTQTDDRNTGANPSQKCSLVRQMI